jgi:hypothetical protein
VASLSPVQISKANADLKLPPVGKTEVIRWKSADGKEIEGLLTYPFGYQAGQKVPLILNIHGGPAGVFQQTFVGGRGSIRLRLSPLADTPSCVRIHAARPDTEQSFDARISKTGAAATIRT